jgi:hypothetical protein
MTSAPLTHVRTWLTQTPVVFPTYVDRISEWWWSQPARVRMVMPVVLLLLAGLLLATFVWRDDTSVVLVATRDIPPGTVLSPADVTRQTRPSRFTPPASVTTIEGVAVHAVAQGSVVTRHHVGDGGASTRVPDGHVAVALHRESLPPFTVGDTVTFVDVRVDGQFVTVSSAALLFHTDADVLWFAVLLDDAAHVTAASHTGRIGAILHQRRETTRTNAR